MFRLCSKGCEHILRALVEIGAAPDAKRLRAKEICARAGVPEAYTRKMLHTLVERGFLESSLGPGGGYALNRPLSEISLLEIIYAVEGPDMYEGCVMGIEGCGDGHPCPLHGDWEKMRGRLKGILRDMTLEQFADSARRLNIGGARSDEGEIE